MRSPTDLLGILVGVSILAVLPGVVLLGLFGRARHAGLAVGGGAWLLYALYETGVRLRLLCSGECNIRVDLLLIYPVLLGLTVAGLVAFVRRPRPRSDQAPPTSQS